MENYYLYFKALHIVFMVTWFAGLFYIVRLFIYHRETSEKGGGSAAAVGEQLKLMANRLWYIITWTGMVLTVIFGLLLILARPSVMQEPWFHVKMTFGVLLIVYHFSIEAMIRRLNRGEPGAGAQKLRLYNEFPTVILFAMVFLAVMKNMVSLLYGFAGLLVLMVLLMVGVSLYKKKREKGTA